MKYTITYRGSTDSKIVITNVKQLAVDREGSGMTVLAETKDPRTGALEKHLSSVLPGETLYVEEE